ncbi:DUF3263 domain-containing protein [Glaciihabitans sp. UYNi722]|uniref:DUF3263 domain-containing protein n=1 Tax=Glaciihabitans sp. UYNi722 TaxID=3156344 RepID=UPI003390B518
MTDDDRALLTFEEAHPRDTPTKMKAISQDLRISATRYYQRLQHLMEVPEVIQEFPGLTKRLQRLHARRKKARESRTF